ncbi:ATP-grasp enzyme [Leptolyngbya sp. FACHB-541]|uniref:ATP-grasp enzyme n=1 Tax=Leptolyngbya sp. FACHB-541 TaxID=2692810 RepID=UPI00168A1A46|nr:ATP-grasp enzyme [Leptolyngbya sp. FACHB-541]MBD1997800.1 ATP-grasp enzyme [Leptolyngbya sp. FACHB-541]
METLLQETVADIPSVSSRERSPHRPKLLFAVFQNLGTLALLAVAFPFNLTVVSLALLWNWLRQPFRPFNTLAAQPKNILIAGARMTKTLQLARSFHGAGHRVILIDTEKFWLNGNRFSNTVAKFYTVPDPNQDLEGYTKTLQAIAKAENIDLFIPVAIFAVIYPEGMEQHPLSGYCEVFHFERDIVRMLDDKFAFAEKARSLSLTAPKSFKITAPEQVLNFDFSQEKHQYILKSIPYDAIRRLDLTKLPCNTPEATAAFVNSLPISEKKPWIMQEFIPGQEYCTHSTVRDGKSTLYCCCKSSAFQVNYENVDKPEISEWINRFLESIGGTGQASFDIIQAADGTVYPIECNPRTHSAITMFYNHPGVADAYLNQSAAEPLQPLPDSKPTHWLYHELWRLNEIRSFKQLQTWFKNVWRGKEAIFEVSDPLPFLMVHHWQIPLLLLGNLRRLKSWTRIDFNIGELIE